MTASAEFLISAEQNRQGAKIHNNWFLFVIMGNTARFQRWVSGKLALTVEAKFSYYGGMSSSKRIFV
jgi:hypothetical protein